MSGEPAEATFEAARAAFTAGVQAFEAGDAARAEVLFNESLRLVPGRASTLVNLAAVHQRLGRNEQALAALGQALAAQPDDVSACFHQGQLLQVLERPADALRSYERVLALQPHHSAAWTQRGSLLKDMGRLPEAAESFRQALAHGGDEEMNRYFLASAQAGLAEAGNPAHEAPASAPRRYVQALFDSYAEGFDKHLVDKLGYRMPWLIAEMLQAQVQPQVQAPGASVARRWRAAIDLGCGTGLMGPRLAAHAAAIDGVDLSPLMLERARSLGCYRALACGDIVEHLRGSRERYDLAVAADVFVYIGELEAVFDALARALDERGHFAFSVEEAGPGTQRFELRASSRYAHAEAYLRGLAAAQGFDWVAHRRTALRRDQHQPIGGLLVLLRRS